MSPTPPSLRFPSWIKEKLERYLESYNLIHTLEMLISFYCVYGGPAVTILLPLELSFNEVNGTVPFRRYFSEEICSRFVQRGVKIIFVSLTTAEQGPWFSSFKHMRDTHFSCQQRGTCISEVVQVTGGFVHSRSIWGAQERCTSGKGIASSVWNAPLEPKLRCALCRMGLCSMSLKQNTLSNNCF